MLEAGGDEDGNEGGDGRDISGDVSFEDDDGDGDGEARWRKREGRVAQCLGSVGG